MKAFILAAGLGTRLGEETRNKPKALVEVGGKPLLQHAIEKLRREGIEAIIVNVHHFAGMVTAFLEKHDFGIPVSISDETGQLLDTGGGLKKAAPLLADSDPVLVYNVDILSNMDVQQLAADHHRSGALATLAVRKRPSNRNFRFTAEKRLAGWINRKTGETKISLPGEFEKGAERAFNGIHVVSPEAFHYFPAADCFSLTDWYLGLAKDHLIKGYCDDASLWMDVGNPARLQKAREVSQFRPDAGE